LRFQVTTLGKLFTHTRASITEQYNLVSGQGAVMPCGWEGNRRSGSHTGHASQTSVVYPPTGSRPKEGR